MNDELMVTYFKFQAFMQQKIVQKQAEMMEAELNKKVSECAKCGYNSLNEFRVKDCPGCKQANKRHKSCSCNSCIKTKRAGFFDTNEGVTV